MGVLFYIRGRRRKRRGFLLSGMHLVYITLEALLAPYGDNSTVPLESPVYGYISDI